MGAPGGSEVGWFAALCDDDFRFLGVPDPSLASSWAHCRAIVEAAERGGFDTILLPSGYELGIDPVTFAAGVAAVTDRIRLLVAVRSGELWPPQLARQLASLADMLDSDRDPHGASRLTVNVISSDLPGAPIDSAPRYRRTREVMVILRSLLAGEPVEHHGEFYDVTLEPPRIARAGRRPPLYFGGLSDPARAVAAELADVYLMWPDTLPAVASIIEDLRHRAAQHGRRLRFGYRVLLVVRDTEAEAREAAARLISRLDPDTGRAIRSRSLDTASTGVARQAELRAGADLDGFVEEHLWTGIGMARSGCGAALVGDPDQVVAKLRAYEALGIDCFILSGYPHVEECERVARDVLPRLRS